MRPPPKSTAWTSSWQAFVIYALMFASCSWLPIPMGFRGAILTLGLFCAFLAGTMRTLNMTRPLWDRDYGDPERYCDCPDRTPAMGETESTEGAPHESDGDGQSSPAMERPTRRTGGRRSEDTPAPQPVTPAMGTDAVEHTRLGHYLSTYCLHDEHEDCRLHCKMCHAPCRCDCHAETPDTGGGA